MSEYKNIYNLMSSEYISKLDVLDILVDYFGEYARVPMLLEEKLDDIKPADVVEVVRCKDCVYNDRGWCGSQEYGTRHVEDNDYCSCGEREDGESE